MSEQEIPRLSPRRPAPQHASRRAIAPLPGRVWWADRPHRVRFATGLAAGPVVITILVGLGGQLLFPDSDPMLRRLLAVLVLVAAAGAVVARAHAWRRVAAAGPATWTHPGLLVVPALIALAPLVTGIALPAAGLLTVLVVGYAATGVFEELWHRGIILDTLRGSGARRAAIIGGALFACSHLANIAFGQPVAVSLAQAVGAFCFGVGFSVFRWRTNAVWLMAAIHGVGDLMFHITGLHGGMLWGFLVGHDILMLLWGLWCLRGLDNDVSVRRHDAAAGPAKPAGAQP